MDPAVLALHPNDRALLLRVDVGMSRVNRLTDIYNAVSALHEVSPEAEDLDRYVGPPRLLRVTGQEPFDTTAGGELAVEHPGPGDTGVRAAATAPEDLPGTL